MGGADFYFSLNSYAHLPNYFYYYTENYIQDEEPEDEDYNPELVYDNDEEHDELIDVDEEDEDEDEVMLTRIQISILQKQEENISLMKHLEMINFYF